jgi:predicted nuclease of restriction endonuclease-like (RecB) superfamily
LAKKGQLVEKPQDILKEPLVLEFLGLDEQARYSESATRAEPAGFAGSGASWEGMGTLPGFPSTNDGAIISQIERFLLEMGKGFLFEARQKRFSFDDDHFFVDLVFYNRLLRCYVLVDLKLGKLTHQDLGQMQMYVNYFDRHVRTQGENRTVGIVLCTKKNQALVTITLPKGSRIHAREYQLYLPSKEVLQKKLAEWAGKAADA